jgi:hypothetical protein
LFQQQLDDMASTALELVSITTLPAAASDAFDENVAKLPQEIQDMILDLVLVAARPRQCHPTVPRERRPFIRDFGTPNPRAKAIYINHKSYKPPLELQLNRKMRATFAKAYYGENTFFFMVREGREGDLRMWLLSLTPKHRGMIKNIKVDGLLPGDRLPEYHPWQPWVSRLVEKKPKEGGVLGLWQHKRQLFPGGNRLIFLERRRDRHGDVKGMWYCVDGNAFWDW